jgi:hypothetical protein
VPKFTPPPVSTEQEIEAWANCQYALCPGSGQEKVPAVRNVVEHSFESRGGDIPGIENSQVYLRFVNETDSTCAVCGAARVLSEQVRPTYQPLSGHDPMGLVNGSVARYDPNYQNTPDDERTAKLEAELAQARREQQETAETLKHFMAAFVPADEIEDGSE